MRAERQVDERFLGPKRQYLRRSLTGHIGDDILGLLATIDKSNSSTSMTVRCLIHETV